jgi:hypothetical protein
MSINLDGVPGWVWTLAAVVVPAALCAAVVTRLVLRKDVPALERARQRADRLTYLAAVIGTVAMAEGMFRVFRDTLGFTTDALLWSVFAFFEIGTVVCGMRARVNLRESAARNQEDPTVKVSAGADGIAVYVFAMLSGILAAGHEHTAGAVFGRLAIAAAASWLWHRSLAVLRAYLTGRARGTIRWRITPERILVALRLADATDRTVVDVDRQRRLADITKAAFRLHTYRATDAWKWRQEWAEKRLRRHVLAAAGHVELAADNDVRQAIRSHLAVLYGTAHGTSPAAVADLDPWTPAVAEHDTSTPDEAHATSTNPVDDDVADEDETAGGTPDDTEKPSVDPRIMARALRQFDPAISLDAIAGAVGKSRRTVERYVANGHQH